ncbi:MAG TPA: hypothetical protein VH089_15810 [Streptosporangiaceae bacterium]|nr:hypothetical protein [Streptosporangiaceae bacterium]
MTTVAAASGADRVEGGRPPSALAGLAWVTWRQQRAALLGLAGFLAVVAGCEVLSGLWAQGTISDPAGNCVGAGASIPCVGSSYLPILPYYAGLLVPLAIGMFLGAPLLAREYAAGTTRFAWTQDVGRVRQTATKLVLLGLAVLVAAGLAGGVTQWATRPVPGQEAMFNLGWVPAVFGGTALTGATGALACYAVGVLAGALTRRVVPAMVATAAALIVLAQFGYGRLYYAMLGLGARRATDQAFGASRWTAQVAHPDVPGGRFVMHYPIGRTEYAPGAPVRWLDQGWYADAHGHPLRGAALTRVLQHPYQLTRLHDTFWVSYQPVSRFWLFQSGLGGAEFLLALILGALAVWLVRRRNA